MNYSVHGLNLTVPEDARAVIKPWDKRNDTDAFAESNVDDQVRLCHTIEASLIVTSRLNSSSNKGHHTHSFCRECPNSCDPTQVWYVRHEIVSVCVFADVS